MELAAISEAAVNAAMREGECTGAYLRGASTKVNWFDPKSEKDVIK